MTNALLVLNGLMERDQTGSKHSKYATDERQSVLDPAKAQEQAPESDRARRQSETDKILVDADQRDDAATARDVASDKRELVADLKAFLDPTEPYGGLDQRRAAVLDRSHAKGDREASAQDRAELTKLGPDPEADDLSSEAP